MTITQPASHPASAEAFRKLRGAAGAALALGAFANAAALTLPLYSMQVYDRVLMSRNITTLVMLTLIALFWLAVHAALDGLRTAILTRCAVGIDRVLSERWYDGAVRGSVNASAGNCLRDTAAIREFVAGGLAAFLDLPWAPLFLVLAFALHPLLGMVALAGTILTVAMAALNEICTRDALGAAARHGGEAERRLAGVLRDPGSLFALGMVRTTRDLWLRSHEAALVAQATAGERAGHLLALAKLVRMGVQVAIMSVAAYLVIERAIQPGVIFAASLLIGRALAPIEQAVGAWRKLRAAWQAVGKVTAALTEAAQESERIDLPAPAGRVTVHGLTVAAPGTSEPLLKDVSFAVEPGEVLLVVGPSGAGKTTLMRALLGIRPGDAGTVRLDGATLAQRDADRLGRHIGYVAQNVVLFEGTVAQNIARHGDTDSESVLAAAQAADVHEWILRLPLGYETEVGACGDRLSGGMRQRIALARALHGNPSLIVLDEPNSQIEPAGDQALVQVIRRLKEAGKTVIVVSHKTGLIPAADKIMVMGNGAVQAFGPRDEVLQRSMRPRVVGASAAPLSGGCGPTAPEAEPASAGAEIAHLKTGT
jgi:ATP-binding cassette subfamily C protein